MWSKTFSKRVKGLDAAKVWSVWSDINAWPQWLDDVQTTRLEGEVTTGAKFLFQPKGGPKLTLELTAVEPGRSFVDMTRFPLARMYDAHDVIDHGDEIEIRSTVSIQGPLALLWRKVVAEGVAASLEHQTDALIARVRERS